MRAPLLEQTKDGHRGLWLLDHNPEMEQQKDTLPLPSDGETIVVSVRPPVHSALYLAFKNVYNTPTTALILS